MKSLIIGSSGFLGKRLCDFLKNKGDEVIEFDIKNNTKQDARFESLPLEGVDRVFFLAWDVGGAKYLYKKDSQIFQMEWNNAIMNNVFPQIINLPFIFISSQLSENVDTVYGSQKRIGEVWTKLSEKGIAVRLWNIYGYNEEVSERSHVISDFVFQAVKNEKIEILTDGSEVRQFIHIDDVCEALLAAFNIKDKSKTYDISTGEWVDLYNIAKIIQKNTNCSIIKGNKKGESLIIQNKEYVPNWKPKISLEEGIKKMIKNLNNEQN
jgi:nucleoside-diphosphate-sugar epimerase